MNEHNFTIFYFFRNKGGGEADTQLISAWSLIRLSRDFSAFNFFTCLSSFQLQPAFKIENKTGMENFHFGKLKINCIKNEKNNSKIPSDRAFHVCSKFIQLTILHVVFLVATFYVLHDKKKTDFLRVFLAACFRNIHLLN
jgi:hypothetical protein